MGEPALKKLNAAAVPKLRFGDGNTFYGANNVSITSQAKQADTLFNVAKKRGLPLDTARLSASFLTGLTPKNQATQKGGRKRSIKKRVSRRRKMSRRKSRKARSRQAL
jgi:hypothetical protein